MPLRNYSLTDSLHLGNMKNGEIKFPDVLMRISTVTNWPLSAELRLPTCFLPRAEITLDGLFGTVILPVSLHL